MSRSWKLTRNQSVVLAVLQAAGQPLSAYQILDEHEVRANGLKAPLTIYRALEKLMARGLVHRIESLNAFIACQHDDHVEPAAFMICDRCKQAIEFAPRSLLHSLVQHASDAGFAVREMHLELKGLCVRCRE